MSIWIRPAIVVLAAVGLAAQGGSGEIAGRLTDKERGVLPGARVRISSGEQSRETVTNSEGRFSLPSLTFGTYHVQAELPGFKAVSGTIEISAATPLAFVNWSMELGCLEFHDHRVILGPKGAAPLADAIVHLRVASPARSALISVAPQCGGRVVREYSVQVLDSISGRGRAMEGQRHLFVEPRGAELVVGHEYLALLWFDATTTDDLVLPIASGRVFSKEGELNGLSPRAALDLLAKWSEARKR